MSFVLAARELSKRLEECQKQGHKWSKSESGVWTHCTNCGMPKP